MAPGRIPTCSVSLAITSIWLGGGSACARLGDVWKLSGVLGHGVAILTLALCGSASAAALTAHGSAEQVYATGLSPHARVSLLSPSGTRVATEKADKAGGVLFTDISPGSGYRVPGRRQWL